VTLCTTRKGTRHRNGQGLVEVSVTLSLLLPLFLIILHVTCEVAHAYMIKSALTQAASRATRNMTIAYWQDESIATNRGAQDSVVYDKLRVQGMIVDSRQFSDASFDLASSPPTVTVTVTYTGGSFGLPKFPDPDPLGLGSRFIIKAAETQALE
jgi:hypothetical protein